jgi:predicted transcriptional regulator
MLTKMLTEHVPIPLIERVDEIAARMERSRGWVVKQALSAWVDQEETHRRLTLEAMADVEQGCSLIINQCRLGLRVWVQISLFQCHVDGLKWRSASCLVQPRLSTVCVLAQQHRKAMGYALRLLLREIFCINISSVMQHTNNQQAAIFW